MGDLLSEVKDLVLAYVRERTLHPVKGLARFLIAGTIGSVLLALGIGTLMLAALRALQTTTGGAFGGRLSWLPYVIVAAGGTILAAASGAAAMKGRKAKR